MKVTIEDIEKAERLVARPSTNKFAEEIHEIMRDHPERTFTQPVLRYLMDPNGDTDKNRMRERIQNGLALLVQAGQIVRVDRGTYQIKK